MRIVAAIGMGTNLGDRLATLRGARDRLATHPRITLCATSRIYDTEPMGPPQPRYRNAAVAVETDLDPRELLEILLTTERAFGRERGERWGPRTLDLDILVVLDAVTRASLAVDEPGLVIPHAHLTERAFALAPLLDVLPELESEYGSTLRTLGRPSEDAETL